MGAFDYPAEPHSWRHAPRGYLDVESFRPWLRDEFSFRCVYCLRREAWDLVSPFHIDHFLPLIENPTEGLKYENLRYACARCNLVKSDQALPDSLHHLISRMISVRPDGTLEARDEAAEMIVRLLRLNSPDMVKFRRTWLQLTALAQSNDEQLYRELLGFPEDLPDLQRLTPPGNDRPEGIQASYHEQRSRGELPLTY